MYELHPPRVFVHKRVHRNRLAVKRMEPMLQGLGNPPTEDVAEADADGVPAAAGLDFHTPPGTRGLQGGVQLNPEPVFLFNTFAWDAPAPAREVAGLNGIAFRSFRQWPSLQNLSVSQMTRTWCRQSLDAYPRVSARISSERPMAVVGQGPSGKSRMRKGAPVLVRPCAGTGRQPGPTGRGR